MKIQEFTRDSFQKFIEEHPEMRREFYSGIFGRTFPLKEDLVAKLDPIKREEVQSILQQFHRINGVTHSNLENHPYRFNKNEYFLFRYRIPLKENNITNIHIRFRTLSEDKLVDDFLEFLQESTLVRYCCETQGLIALDESLDRAYQIAYANCLNLIKYPKQMLRYIKEGIREEWIRDKLTHIFDAFHLMKKRGHDIKTVMKSIENIDIPSDKEKEDIIWKRAFEGIKTIP